MEKINLREGIRIKQTIEEKDNKNDRGLTICNNSKVIEANGKEIGFYTVVFISGNLTIEYNLFSKYRNKGIGKEFLKLVIELVEKEYPEANTLYLRILPTNEASLKVAKDNNFVPTDDEDIYKLLSEGDYYVLDKINSRYNPKKYVKNHKKPTLILTNINKTL